MSSEDYFKSYRDKLRELEDYRAKVNLMQVEVANIRKTIVCMQNECIKMRSIITIMIEEDIDDVEAKLRGETSTVSLWDDEGIRGLTYYHSRFCNVSLSSS